MKKKTDAKLKKELWKLVSEYVRRKSRGICFTCGTQRDWKQLHCGHYIRASAGLSTYFEPKNLHAQCYACNIWRDGNSDEYALRLKATYGDGILEELNEKKHRIVKNFPFLEEIERYKKLLETLD